MLTGRAIAIFDLDNSDPDYRSFRHTCALAEFIEANRLEPEELADLLADLRTEGRSLMGGGAAPIVEICLLP